MLDIKAVRAAVQARFSPVPTGVPSTLYFDNEAFDPDPGVPHLVVEVRALTRRAYALAQNGGPATDTGRITCTFYGPNDAGADAFDDCMNALNALFAAGTRVGSGADTIIVNGMPSAPVAGGIVRYDDSFSYQQFTAPWYAFTRNTVTA